MSTLRYKCFNNDHTLDCNRLMDYYNNEQLKYVTQMLDGSYLGGLGKRKDWHLRGYIPRARNLTKSVVDKSAMVFNQPPKLETYSVQKQVVPNPTLDTIMYNADWLPFWQNVAAITRLLKSVVVYNQKYIPVGGITENQIYKYNPFNGDSLKQIVTHHGNSEVIMDPSGRYIVEYAYLTDLDDAYYSASYQSEPIQYMVITPKEIETWLFVDDNDILVDSQPNPEGFVPAFFVHDTNKPIYCAWNNPGTDLAHMNEMVNLHITDTEFAMAHQKNKTLFTNGMFVQPNSGHIMLPTALAGHTDPGASYDTTNITQSGTPSLGGLGSIVQVESADNSRDPFIKFDGPVSDLSSLNDVMAQLIEDVAQDWNVNIKFGGAGSANSGFQLVVEEMDGLNLRAKQIQFYQAAFKIMYQMLQRMYPELPMGELLIQFAPPSLPVNEKEREENWVSKITGSLKLAKWETKWEGYNSQDVGLEAAII